MGQPTCVVFDIGGVLLDWDPRNLYRKLFAGDDAAMDDFLANVCSPVWNLEQDRGRPWAEAEAELIAKFPQHEALIRAYRARWIEMIAGPIDGSVAILNELHAARVPLYSITNFAADTLTEGSVRFRFLNLFRDVVVSGTERVLKPDPEIYRILIERNHLVARDTVFIDDREENAAGARAVGMQAIHFTSPDTLRRDLVNMGFTVLQR